MALAQDVQAAISRMRTFYEGTKPYNAATNPGGFRQGGHLVNFVSALQDAALAINAAGSMVDQAVAASAGSPKAVRVDSSQQFTDDEKAQGQANLGIAGAITAAVSKAGDAMTGKLTMRTGAPIEIQGNSNSPPFLDLLFDGVIRLRQIVDGSGSFILRNAGNNDAILTVTSGGALSTKQIGDVATALNNRLTKNTTNDQEIASNLKISKTYPTLQMNYPGVMFAGWQVRDDGYTYLMNLGDNTTILRFGPSGDIITKQFNGGVSERIESRGAAFRDAAVQTAKDYTDKRVPYTEVSSGDQGNTIVRRYGGGQIRCVDGQQTAWGFAMVNNDGRIGRFQMQNGYIEVIVDGAYYGITIQASDRRMKENVKPVRGRDEMAKIDAIEFVSFDWRPDAPTQGHRDLGVIAQDLQAIEPSWVLENRDGNMQLDLQGLLTSSLRANQQLHGMVRDLTARVEHLEGGR